MTTILTIAGGVPLSVGLLCSIAIWGYIMGRRHESTEREGEEEREAYARRRKRGRKAYELEGEEVLEMETRANCAEMDDEQRPRPPVEMEGRREPVELSAESWVKLLGTLR
ncbi:hypothetical protein SLS58_007342 [Diplodia intermedia]|uniref:Transmembrane protein n=1 Tax=Diplodia intermedia TaxID=856260 RepID=A0ABR3TKP8_9PEZI